MGALARQAAASAAGTVPSSASASAASSSTSSMAPKRASSLNRAAMSAGAYLGIMIPPSARHLPRCRDGGGGHLGQRTETAPDLSYSAAHEQQQHAAVQ